VAYTEDPDLFAAQLALCGNLPTVLIEEHIDDGTGRCRRCSDGPSRPRHVFPCTTRNLATRALLIQARMHREAAKPGPIWLKGKDRP
jgi:hypothetical protein